MYADEIYCSERNAPAAGRAKAQAAPHEYQNRDLVLKIMMASLPLAGLIFGVVALALWNAN